MRVRLKYTGKYLTGRTPIKTKHRILIFHQFEYGRTVNNMPYDDILSLIPDAYCDGLTIYLPNDFDREIIGKLIEFFKEDHYSFPDNIAQIGYVNDEVNKLVKIYEHKQPQE
ncbi:hypothetical protein [Aneurinibacillus aneurinilyticus]|nr:hypothetical protein [Aneurinibacillus aneurinilyticus]MED0705891.1 hypothetical protein [Aneurinibacillus aneurinilyticus]MED0722720.1 hypothetical protein [Aneurinibacillus aneurinilyticus]MED0731360.1 hypothetical protein [Aneurinibacillus aneurinilyticus]MED0740116.1 hypothetical protein [Aneurinibacillus aneurinilyticus]